MVEANLPKSTFVVQKHTEFEIDLAKEGADIKVILAYHAATKVGQSTHQAPLKFSPVKFVCSPPSS